MPGRALKMHEVDAYCDVRAAWRGGLSPTTPDHDTSPKRHFLGTIYSQLRCTLPAVRCPLSAAVRPLLLVLSLHRDSLHCAALRQSSLRVRPLSPSAPVHCRYLFDPLAAIAQPSQSHTR